MKVLHITSKPIYPIIDGGCFASQRLLKTLLHTGAEIQHISIETAKHPFSLEAYPKEIAEIINPAAAFIDTSVKVFSALSSLLKRNSYNVDRFDNEVMKRLIRLRLESFLPEVVVFDGLYTAPYLKLVQEISSCKTILRTHNVEYNIWDQYKHDSRGVKRIYLNILSKYLRRYECEILPKFDHVLSISKDDSEILSSIAPNANVHTLGVAIESSENHCNYTLNDFYHVGVMNWQPNIDAALELVLFMKDVPGELHLAGKGAEVHIDEQDASGLHVHGFVEDIDGFVNDHGILVSPIRIGSGIRVKILESMALGKPIITTAIGAAGIEYEKSKCLTIAESREDFIQAMTELSSNAHLREEIGRNAHSYIRKNHNIEEISKQLLELLQS